MKTIARHVHVSGFVQGVGFRHHTKVRARELGLGGFVRNCPDGRVEVWAEGLEPRVDELVAWLRSGPSSAHVASAEVLDVEPTGDTRFVVRFD